MGRRLWLQGWAGLSHTSERREGGSITPEALQRGPASLPKSKEGQDAAGLLQPGAGCTEGLSLRGSVWPCPAVTPAHPHTHSPKTPHFQPRWCSAPCPSHGRGDRAPEQQRRCFPSQQQQCKASAQSSCAWLPWLSVLGTHTLPCLLSTRAQLPAQPQSSHSSHNSRHAQWVGLSQPGLGECELCQQQSQPRGLSPGLGTWVTATSHGQGRLQPGPGGHRGHGESRHSPCSPHIHRWSCLPPPLNQAASSSVPKR